MGPWGPAGAQPAHRRSSVRRGRCGGSRRPPPDLAHGGPAGDESGPRTTRRTARPLCQGREPAI